MGRLEVGIAFVHIELGETVGSSKAGRTLASNSTVSRRFVVEDCTLSSRACWVSLAAAPSNLSLATVTLRKISGEIGTEYAENGARRRFPRNFRRNQPINVDVRDVEPIVGMVCPVVCLLWPGQHGNWKAAFH